MSHAHGWATGPASALSQRVLGLRPLGAATAADDATTAATDDDDAAGGGGGGPQQVLVSKRIVCATKSDIILPRQARDKRGESTQKRAFFLG